MERVGAAQLGAGALARAVGAIARRPMLWPTALRQLFRLARPGWWRSWPPVPTPEPGYAHFRLVTQYGGDGGSPTTADIVAYLAWCRETQRT